MKRPLFKTHFSQLFTRKSRFFVFMILLSFFMFLCVKFLDYAPSPPLSNHTSIEKMVKIVNSDAKIKDNTTANLEEQINNFLSNTEFSNMMDILSRQMFKLKGKITEELYESGFSEPNAMLCPEMGNFLRALILITSAPDHWDERQNIRKTWGVVGKLEDVALAFLIGATHNESTENMLHLESTVHGDLIRGNFIDSYKNLTLKTMSMLEWTLTYCTMTPYVIKTDDDMFINTDFLFDFLNENSVNEQRIYGNIAENWMPHRSNTSKWYLSEETFDKYKFPDFTKGPIYILTGDIIYNLYTTALKMPFLWLEDVFLTGFVAHELSIPRIDLGDIPNMVFSINVTQLLCHLPDFVAVHAVNATYMHTFWHNLQNPETSANCTISEETTSQQQTDKFAEDPALNEAFRKLSDKIIIAET